MLPTFNEQNGEWEVEYIYNGKTIYDFGNLQSVFETFSQMGLYYPYKIKDSTIIDDWQGHCHTFNQLLNVIADEYEFFSIEGFEDYYSKQEREFIQAILNAYKQHTLS